MINSVTGAARLHGKQCNKDGDSLLFNIDLGPFYFLNSEVFHIQGITKLVDTCIGHVRTQRRPFTG